MKRFITPLLMVVLGVVVALPFPGNSATYRPPASSIANDSITSAKINDGTIVNADISASASINESKLNFDGIGYEWPTLQGASSTALTNDGSGNLMWMNPGNLFSTTYSTSTGSQYVPVTVATSSTLLIWATWNTAVGGSACDSHTGHWATLGIRQASVAATTTISTTGSVFGSDAGCSHAFQATHVSTTTEVVWIDFATAHNGAATLLSSVTTLLIPR